jgi:DNA helicase-2/ATP-dependent DNA helicase PcrA
VAELPKAHVSEESSLSGGASLWRAQWSERDDPFAHVARDKPERQQGRGPGWQRAATQTYDATPRRIAEPTRSAASFAAKPRLDIRAGDRVTHDKFGEGIVAAQDGNRLEIDFDAVGRKRVLDSFVRKAG